MKRWVNLIYELTRKDLKTRYSGFGSAIIWMFLSPFLTVGIFYVVFSIVLKVRIYEAPFMLYLMVAVFTWQFFSNSIMTSVSSLIDNRNLIKESNFPHFLIPFSIIFTNMIVFLPALLITTFISIYILKGLSILIIFLPLVFICHLGVIIGLSLGLSTLYVKWRDIKHLVETCLNILFYLTPCFYSLSLIRSSFSPVLYNIYTHNPFVGILSLYRIVLLKGFYTAIKNEVSFCSLVLTPVLFSIAISVLGFYYYYKNRKIINDYLSY